MKTTAPVRMRISDKQWVLLLVGGLFFMLGGSWFSQFEPDRRHRAQMRQSQELPFQIDPSGKQIAPSAYADAKPKDRNRFSDNN
ncbi:MAG: hypothetical protein KA479_06830 [Saprospiraceae bacterium]|nr:hypothetical protein [Saprospiraceae bacterium]